MIRTRFAPSPTGFLHVGGARTALYAWLYARKMGGQFILRIEDTDLERSTPQAVEAILEAMQWLDLNWDEGPYYQTQRFDRYQAVAEQLQSSGHAYYCHCTPERLNSLREGQIAAKQKPRYDGHCRDLQLSAIAGQSALRFRNPLEGSVVVMDAVHGKVVVDNRELDDLVIVRSSGVPTYNFTVVVDDWEMKISHVIRGDDHLNNTPRQINILKALGANLPIYAHIPMILGSDGKRLSKRHGAVSVQHYRDSGVLAPALLNYLVRLGWSHGDQEIFSREQMIEHFDLDHIHTSAAIFNTDKLLWLNQHTMKHGDPQAFRKDFIAQLVQCGLSPALFDNPSKDDPTLEAVWAVQAARVKTLKEMAEKSVYFYQDPPLDRIIQADCYTNEGQIRLKALRQTLGALAHTDWQAGLLHQAIEALATTLGLKLGDIAKLLRLALTGGSVSPPIDQTLVLIGRTRVLDRLDRLIDSGGVRG
jgi:glutamyl-tRNA synthetase